MIFRPIVLIAAIIAVVITSGCGGRYYGGVGPSVGLGVGFYHSTFGHGWGGGYYRGYDSGARDALETMEAIETIEAMEAIDALDSMGMPDFDVGPDLDMGL